MNFCGGFCNTFFFFVKIQTMVKSHAINEFCCCIGLNEKVRTVIHVLQLPKWKALWVMNDDNHAGD